MALTAPTERITLVPGTEEFWVEQLVQSLIIRNWEAQDEPQHLGTIRDRLLLDEQRAGQLLGLYQRVLQAEEAGNRKGDLRASDIALSDREPETRSWEKGNSWMSIPTPPLVPADDSKEQTELLLSGLIEKHNGYLRIKNPIYCSVFNTQWVTEQLDALRPYSQVFNAWVASNYQDQSHLLRGQALRDAQKWLQGKSLSDLDYEFLAANQEGQRQEEQIALEAARAQEVEVQLAVEKNTARWQQFLLIAVYIGLFISIGIGVCIFILYHQTLSSERQAQFDVSVTLLLDCRFKPLLGISYS